MRFQISNLTFANQHLQAFVLLNNQLYFKPIQYNLLFILKKEYSFFKSLLHLKLLHYCLLCLVVITIDLHEHSPPK